MSLFASFANDDDSSGSLWGNDSGGGLFSNPLQDLLDSGNFTLKDVLTQQTLIQEVRNLNESLIKYLKENVKSLIELIVNEEENDDNNTDGDGTNNFDYELLASSASEIFACDVSEINDELTNEENLNILFSVLNRSKLDARSAGNFYKCMLSICKESEERRAELLNYLSTKENVLLTMFIQHMNVDSIAASFRLLLEASDLKPSETKDENAEKTTGNGGGDDGDGNNSDVNNNDQATTTNTFPKPFWPANSIVSSLLRTLHEQDQSQTAYTNIAETLIDAIARSTYTPPSPTSFNFSRSDMMDLNEIAQQQQEEEMQSQSIEQTPMMNALTDQIQQVLDALPNRGAFFIITRILEECGMVQQQQQQLLNKNGNNNNNNNNNNSNENNNTNSSSSNNNILNIQELIVAVENKMPDVVNMITSTNSEEGKMTTNMKVYKPFGIERLLAVELVSVLAAIKPDSVNDDTCLKIFDLMEVYPLHNILHSAIARMITDRGVKINAIAEKIIGHFDRDENDISLEIAYGGHYLDMARALNIESDGITKASKIWETELGNMVLPSSLNNSNSNNNNNNNNFGQNTTITTGELEYDMNNEDEDDSDDSEDDDDDDDDVDDEALRQRYGWGGDDDKTTTNDNSNNNNDSNNDNNNDDDITFDAFGNNNANDNTTIEDISFDAFGNDDTTNDNNNNMQEEMSFAAFGTTNDDAGDDDDEVKFE